MKYAGAYDQEKMARVQGISLPVSFKQSVEICRLIKNKKYASAVRILEDVSEMKTPIPYRRYNRGGTGHRKGMGPGRFPVKTSSHILKLLKSAYSNANQKGLDTGSLVVSSAIAKKGPKTPRYGRNRGRIAKRTHIELTIASSSKKKAEDKTAAKESNDKSPKPEASPGKPDETKKDVAAKEPKPAPSQKKEGTAAPTAKKTEAAPKPEQKNKGAAAATPKKTRG